MEAKAAKRIATGIWLVGGVEVAGLEALGCRRDLERRTRKCNAGIEAKRWRALL